LQRFGKERRRRRKKKKKKNRYAEFVRCLDGHHARVVCQEQCEGERVEGEDVVLVCVRDGHGGDECFAISRGCERAELRGDSLERNVA
jgi:hypothetical protein